MLDGTINFTALEDAINRAFARLVDKFKDLQTEQLEAVKWEWSRKTRRSSGQVVGSPRDIVDTANLKNSLQITTISNTHARYEYKEDYAGLVHQGFDGAGQAGQPLSYPARPWVVSAYEENDLLDIFAQYLAEELR